MTQNVQNPSAHASLADPRWRDLYRLGCISCLVSAAMLILMVGIYFIWGYAPRSATVAEILAVLQTNRLAGLLSLEIQMILIQLFMIPLYLAVYAALKEVNESYALLALVLELMGITLWLTARPVAEMVHLSNHYATATDAVTRSHYLAAGQAFVALFDGTTFTMATILPGIATFISSLLMLQSRHFGKAVAYLGIAGAASGIAILLPAIGPLLGLLSTVVGPLWLALLARTFFRLGWKPLAPAQVTPVGQPAA